MNSGEECCFFRITISPGSQILPLFRFLGEQEILLPRFGEFILTNKSMTKYGVLMFDLTYIPPEASVILDSPSKLSADEWIQLLSRQIHPHEIGLYESEEEAINFIVRRL
jgi:hypothetical protein